MSDPATGARKCSRDSAGSVAAARTQWSEHGSTTACSRPSRWRNAASAAPSLVSASPCSTRPAQRERPA